MFDPDLPFASLPSAAVQLYQTGHSSTVQHFRRVKVGRADKATDLYKTFTVENRIDFRNKSLTGDRRSAKAAMPPIPGCAIIRNSK
ncbi:hypothetical protein EYC08_17335 [Tabrizicola sp. WMC-M-20]|nr:hypothetical protein EYC08_17335 [Tabrizicola sp. WMC-M-20]